MSELPHDDLEHLERRAARERRNLLASIDEVQARVREKFDLEHHIRQHALTSSALAASIAATLGYRAAGIFSRHR